MSQKKMTVKFDMAICNTDDLATLRSLMLRNGCEVVEQTEHQPDAMGVDWGLLVLLMPAFDTAVKEIASVWRIWLSNRHVKFELEDVHTGRVFRYESSKNGISDAQIERLIDFVTRSETGSTAD